jgi:hypothetical protein
MLVASTYIGEGRGQKPSVRLTSEGVRSWKRPLPSMVQAVTDDGGHKIDRASLGIMSSGTAVELPTSTAWSSLYG